MTRFVAFDLATTAGQNRDPRTDRVVAAAVVGHPDVDMAVLMNPGVPITPEATMATGIDDVTAAGGMSYRDGLTLISRALMTAWANRAVVTGYEVASYLLPVLFHQETLVFGRRITRPGPIMDVKSVFRKTHPGGDHSLPGVTSAMGVPLGSGCDVHDRAVAVYATAQRL